ncbi:MAG: retroviral-like aspartic protease family protein [Reyranellaceae bacterium]
MMRCVLSCLLLVALALATPAVATPLDDGVAAARQGDYATALKLWQPLAEQGNASAQYNIGLMYDRGNGVAQDFRQAMEWYRKAAAQGHARSMNNIGVLYQRGQGVARSDTEALAWYRKAAEKGSAPAQYNLGTMYERGEVVPRDLEQALAWYRKSAAQGDTEAQAKVKRLAGEGPARGGRSGVLLKKDGGTYMVPVLINGAITLDFVLDSGASDVSIPQDVVSTLIRTGTLQSSDFIGEKTYVLADGTRIKSRTFRIRSLKVGDHVLENVTGSVAATKGSLLLGQSFLSRFKTWSIDNANHMLWLE